MSQRSEKRSLMHTRVVESTLLGNGRNMVSRVLFWIRNSLSLTEFWGKLGSLPGKRWGPKDSLSSVFGTVLPETVFGPFPRFLLMYPCLLSSCIDVIIVVVIVVVLRFFFVLEPVVALGCYICEIFTESDQNTAPYKLSLSLSLSLSRLFIYLSLCLSLCVCLSLLVWKHCRFSFIVCAFVVSVRVFVSVVFQNVFSCFCCLSLLVLWLLFCCWFSLIFKLFCCSYDLFLLV